MVKNELYSKENKLDILLAVFNEKNSALHNIRSRLQTEFTWIAGFAIGLSWYFFQNNCSFSITFKILLTIFVVAITFWFIDHINCQETGFKNTKKVLIKVEKALNLYNKNYFLEDSIYPEEYKNIDQHNKKTSHFDKYRNIIFFLCFFTIIIIWIKELYFLLKLLKEFFLMIRSNYVRL